MRDPRDERALIISAALATVSVAFLVQMIGVDGPDAALRNAAQIFAASVPLNVAVILFRLGSIRVENWLAGPAWVLPCFGFAVGISHITQKTVGAFAIGIILALAAGAYALRRERAGAAGQ